MLTRRVGRDERPGASIQLTDAVRDVQSMAWAPDGTRIVLDAIQKGRDRVIVVAADGSDERVLVDQGAPQGPGAPAWSPDSTRVAYISTPGSPGSFSLEVWVIGADGSNPTRVFAGTCCLGGWKAPVWSPDGARVAFWDDADAGFDTTWLVVKADGTGKPREIEELEARSWGTS